MESRVNILNSTNPSQDDLSFSKLVNFLGVDCEFFNYNDYLADAGAYSELNNSNILALSASTLSDIQSNQKLYEMFESLPGNVVEFVFVYGISSCPSVNNALCSLSEGKIKSVNSLSSGEHNYEINSGFADICGQLSGLRFGRASKEVDFTLEVDEIENEIDNLITISGQPLFLRLNKGNCQIFVSATKGLVDIQDTVDVNIRIKDFFSGLVPALMFLRHVFKDGCWHNDAALGCLIIDDPSLRRKYGFLNYAELLKVMDSFDFHTSIAFIPWNYNRSHHRVVELFKNNAHRYSLCIHGCDHTGGEFASVHYDELDYKTKEALRRMVSHQAINGLVFDRVMVFPQEIFSSQSLEVLKSNNYLAAVSSGIAPFNDSRLVSIESLLQPAFLEYENFPIFHRRIPENVIDFALDLFFNKPIILFEHHDYFRHGYDDLGGFIRELNSLSVNIKWRNLEDVVKSSYLRKNDNSNIIEIKIYTNKALINNTNGDIRTYKIIKTETGNIPIKSVVINGKETGYNLDDNTLTVITDIEPGENIEVIIDYEDHFPNNGKNASIKNKIKVAMRRYLSDFRDNYVSNNKTLHSLSQMISKRLWYNQ
jgi:hypothetical protein